MYPKYLTGFSVALASDDYDCSFPILLQSLPFCRASRLLVVEGSFHPFLAPLHGISSDRNHFGAVIVVLFEGLSRDGTSSCHRYFSEPSFTHHLQPCLKRNLLRTKEKYGHCLQQQEKIIEEHLPSRRITRMFHPRHPDRQCDCWICHYLVHDVVVGSLKPVRGER
jgi:hypothetical protein